MTEPADEGVFLEIDFRHDDHQMERAVAVVAAAVAELRRDFPASPRIDLMRRQRAEGFFAAFRDLSLIELAVAEYLSREAQGRVALDLAALEADAAALADGLSELLDRLGEARRAMQWSEAKGGGAEVADQVAMAHGQAIDAWQALNLARESLVIAARQVPDERIGRGGALGKLTLAPEVALYLKLAQIWEASGLTAGAGDSGDGIDLILFAALKAVDPEKVAGGRWLEKLREKANRQLSPQNGPPK